MEILKLYRPLAYVTYLNYNRVIYDSNNCNLIIYKMSKNTSLYRYYNG